MPAGVSAAPAATVRAWPASDRSHSRSRWRVSPWRPHAPPAPWMARRRAAPLRCGAGTAMPKHIIGRVVEQANGENGRRYDKVFLVHHLECVRRQCPKDGSSCEQVLPVTICQLVMDLRSQMSQISPGCSNAGSCSGHFLGHRVTCGSRIPQKLLQLSFSLPILHRKISLFVASGWGSSEPLLLDLRIRSVRSGFDWRKGLSH